VNDLVSVAGRDDAAVTPGSRSCPLMDRRAGYVPQVTDGPSGACHARCYRPPGWGVAPCGCPLDDHVRCFPPAPQTLGEGAGGKHRVFEGRASASGKGAIVLPPSRVWAIREEEPS
jgi:hypothetical protein